MTDISKRRDVPTLQQSPQSYHRTKLDSHANMAVTGKHSFPFDKVHRRSCEVTTFDPSIGTSKYVPIVDLALAYDCKYTQKMHILISRNALYVPTLEHNLIPPFILNEAGATCNEKSKIDCSDPSITDHYIIHKDVRRQNPLQLNGIFSFFYTR